MIRALLLSVSVCVLVSCASVSVYLIGEPKGKISVNSVQEYETMPSGAREIANVRVKLMSYYSGAEVKWAVRKRAAALGANGFVITRLDIDRMGFGGGPTVIGGSNYTGFGGGPAGPSGTNYTGEATVFLVQEE